MSKPKSKLMTELDDGQQAQLADWLLSGMPYHQARDLVDKEFGLQLKSLSAFTPFWEQVCAPLLLARRRRAVATADTVAEAAEQRPGQFDRATIDALKQKAFELSIQPSPNPKDVKALFMLVLKSRDQDLAERKIRLLEAKALQADEAERVTKDEALSPEQKQQQLRAIFGMQ